MNPHADISYPVSVVLSRQWRQQGPWQFPDWKVVEILPQHPQAQSEEQDYVRLENGKNADLFVWPGLWLDLFRDGLQSYYQNMIGKNPSLFVLCRDDHPEAGIAPVMISADFADAEAHMETDGIVLSATLVAPFSNWLADYVLHNETLLTRQMQEHKGGGKGKHGHVR